jgi:PII-like signaling protein
MNMQPVTVARVYTMEGHDQLNQALDILHDEQKIVGVTLIRGIAGYGDDREVHTSSLLSLSLELPLVIEFYDEPEKVKIAIKALQSRLDLKHIVTWSAMAFLDASV